MHFQLRISDLKHSIAKVFCPVGESSPKQEVVETCWYIILKTLYMSVYVFYFYSIYIYSTLLPMFFLHMHNSPMMAHDWNQPAKSLCLYKIHWRKKTSVRLGLVSWWSQAIVCAGCAQRVTSTSNFINERVNWCFAVVSLPDVED